MDHDVVGTEITHRNPAAQQVLPKRSKTVKNRRSHVNRRASPRSSHGASTSPTKSMDDSNPNQGEQHELVRTLRQLDPLLQFLTRNSGKLTFPLAMLRAILPAGYDADQILVHLVELHRRGILGLFQVVKDDDNETGLLPNSYDSITMNNNILDRTLPMNVVRLLPSSSPSLLTSTIVTTDSKNYWNSNLIHVGFPPPPALDDVDFTEKQKMQKTIGSLHGTTKAAAQRRFRALQSSLQEYSYPPPSSYPSIQPPPPQSIVVDPASCAALTKSLPSCPHPVTPFHDIHHIKDIITNDVVMSELPTPSCSKETISVVMEPLVEIETQSEDEREARQALSDLFHWEQNRNGSGGLESTKKKNHKTSDDTTSAINCSKNDLLITSILPHQVSYVGSHPSKMSQYDKLSSAAEQAIPRALMVAYGLETGNRRRTTAYQADSSDNHNPSPVSKQPRQLYTHQVAAVESALHRMHTLVCTGTGSGKSLCFWLPVLSAAYHHSNTSTSSNGAMLTHAHNDPSNKQHKGTALRDSLAVELAAAAGPMALPSVSPEIEEPHCVGGAHGYHGGGGVSFVIFPTKALAQDQLSQLQQLLATSTDLQQRIRPATLDGDTPHSSRAAIAQHCNVILTNPDTIHSAILPHWKDMYRNLLKQLEFVILDEAHLYEGIFGAHVALVLARLHRICAAAMMAAAPPPKMYEDGGSTTDIAGDSKSDFQAMMSNRQLCHHRRLPTYLACSATMSHPEHHFRLLCPIAEHEPVRVLTADQDGSPRSAKHFFIWNPPILDKNGLSLHQVIIPRRSSISSDRFTTRRHYRPANRRKLLYHQEEKGCNVTLSEIDNAQEASVEGRDGVWKDSGLHRRHAAEETALLLARAVSCGVRCLAFCKTRMVVEWVYERTISALQSDSSTAHLATKVESYRGGYNTMERRMIEQRLFQNELIGVVATCALEVGVDIGGIDVTLHCGFPTSYASLLQQAGRAGRGKSRLNEPSVAIMVCFNSPAEQHIWRHPTRLLDQSSSSVPSMPFNLGVVQGHLLCASDEFPLTGRNPLTILQRTTRMHESLNMTSDCQLFGSGTNYDEAMQALISDGLVVQEQVPVVSDNHNIVSIFKAHLSTCRPWMRVSLRSVEPVNYSIVDISHPGQGGRTDRIYDEKAVMDHLPYSRVFYHAFPGAIITHRGRRYLVQSMTRPPPITPFMLGARGCTLAAYAKPTSAKYITRPLSTLQITIVKQLERIDFGQASTRLGPLSANNTANHASLLSFAGGGVLNVKRSVHGFKKLSMATLSELSRTEISMPPMEYDTYGIWIDTDANHLISSLDDYGSGVHALSHALIAVAPIFVNCSLSDLDCEHSYFDPTRVVLFDARPGGLGVCAQLWKYLFSSKGLLDSAIELLENCTTCSGDTSYKGGCPACIQSIQCMKFNLHLSKQTGLEIAKRMRQRLDESCVLCDNTDSGSTTISSATPDNSPCRRQAGLKRSGRDSNTPRRQARAKALHIAKDLHAARDRNIVVGRPAWPFDDEGCGAGKQEKPE